MCCFIEGATLEDRPQMQPGSSKDFQPGNYILCFHPSPNHPLSQSERYCWTDWEWKLYFGGHHFQEKSLELGALLVSIKAQLCIFYKNKVTRRTDPNFWLQVNSAFLRSQEINCPSFCLNSSQVRERPWHMLNIRRALKAFPTEHSTSGKQIPCLFLFLFPPNMENKMFKSAISCPSRLVLSKHTRCTSWTCHMKWWLIQRGVWQPTQHLLDMPQWNKCARLCISAFIR